MHPVPLKRWLKQQQQIIDNCTAIFLVQMSCDDKPGFIIQFPETTSEKFIPSPAISSAIKEVLQKQRLHLAPMSDGQMLMAQPIAHQGKLWGAVILQLATHDKKEIPATLKRLQQGMVWLQFLLSQQDTTDNSITEQHPQAAQLLQMMGSLLKENTLQETAISLVNFLATQLQSPRVCLGLQVKSGIELTAVSFSANFDKRTSAMQAISDAMDEAADQRLNIHVDANTISNQGTISNQATTSNQNTTIIQRCHENLLKQQQVAALDSFLLRKDSQIIGVITLEQKNAQLNHEQTEFLQSALIMVCDLITLKQASEGNIRQQIKSQTHHKLKRVFGDNKLTQKLFATALFLFICVLFFPANYWIANDASLQSTYKFLVVAPQDGYLADIKVRPGVAVKKGDVLAQLNDEDLRLERRKLFSQMQQSQQEYDNALANANRAQAAIANEKVEQANSQLQLIEQQQARTQLLASSDGIITSDDISQSLGAPVKQGQILFEISANKGYLVQLWVDERDITYFHNNQAGKIKLTSIPNEVFDVTVKSVSPISEIREGKNYFRVEAVLNRESDLLRPGMTGSGKVLAGREFLGWIWFHDIWYWLRLKLWF